MAKIIKKINKNNNGVALLLVIILSAAILSIMLEVFDITFVHLTLAGSEKSSYVALNAADWGIERTLYVDRVQGLYSSCESPCSVSSQDVNKNGDPTLPFGNCYNGAIVKSGGNTQITITGKSNCSSSRFVKRAFQVNYSSP